MTKINSKKIHIHRSYLVKEIPDLLGVVEKTCLRWIKIGLRTVGDRKHSMLINGFDLKEFLKNKDSKKNARLKPNEFWCFTCRGPTTAKRGSARIRNGNKMGICSVCKGKVCRTIKLAKKDYKITVSPVQMSFFNNSPNNH